jgi:branched-chain amino acid transport system substrate-binding protein
MLNAGPDAVMIVASAVDVARIAQLVRRADAGVALLSSTWAASEELVALGGAAVEGMLVPQMFDRENASVSFNAFRDAYRARFGELPGFAAVASYDATSLALDALARAGDGKKIKGALINRSFDGLQQRIEIDAYGDSRREIRMTSVRKGKFVSEKARATAGT